MDSVSLSGSRLASLLETQGWTSWSNYLLLSQSRSQYTFLNGLSDCHECQDEQYICYHLHTMTSTSNPTCEIELLSPHMTKIPASCTTKTIKATIETWHHIGRNQWIYILQKPTTFTIMCGENENHLEDVILEKSGLIQLEPKCRGYTDQIVSESTRDSTKNATYYIPHMNIIADDCCILQTHFSTIESITLKPIHLTNIDLKNLQIADKKLNEFDEIITKQMNEPFIVTHTRWYNVSLGIIAAFIIIFRCCKCFGQIDFFHRLRYPITNPRNRETKPPLISNFVNCIFDSSEPSSTSVNEIVTYRPRQDVPAVPHRVPEISDDDEVPPTIRFPTRQRPRRNTTPI
ncbi:uncharacterized protein LOC135161523 isoform X2 [Diachasmimorpha longicaudata]|uniref:uncharacterized protein LOC135161523 isoform X2 n=1 Tax=Diachasmimorpha longicaudata TaxID=58733 RepID=UPI0030B8D08D